MFKIIPKKKTVYVGLAADILHKGHINILKKASNYGEVTVGLLTDKAIASYKRIPHLNYQQRESVVKNIRFVKKVIPQKTLDYSENLLKIKPDFVVHGDDWKKGVQKKTRLNVVKILKKWSGKLIEPKYTKDISSSILKKKIIDLGTTPEVRKNKLKRLLEIKPIVKILESHSPLTGLIIENLNINDKINSFLEFDGMWSSSLTDSALRGKPDNQAVDYSVRINGLSEILDVTTKPIIFDGDNGGKIEHLPYLIKSLERLGVSSIIIEDKRGLKKNSLFKDQNKKSQESIKVFCNKIKKIKSLRISSDFLIVARVESLILGNGINDALKRSIEYSKAGADLIMIHSKEKKPNTIFRFAKMFKKNKYFKPLVAVPSTYSKTYERDLIQHGFKIVIYANQLLRSSYPAMLNTARDILINRRSYEAEKKNKLISISSIINLIK